MNKILLLLSLAIITKSALAEPLEYEGQKFQAVKYGNKLAILPLTYKISVEPKSHNFANECQSLEQTISRLSFSLQRCGREEYANSSHCKSVRTSLMHKGEGRIMADHPQSEDALSDWEIELPQLSQNTKLVGYAAQVYGLNIKNVSLVDANQYADKFVLTSFALSENSLMQQVVDVMGYTQEQLIEQTHSKGFLIKNKFLACDLLLENVSLGFGSGATYAQTISVDRKTIETIWKVYSELDKKLTNVSSRTASEQSMWVGYYLAQVLENVDYRSEHLKPNSLFKKLFSFDDENYPQLKQIANSENLRYVAYPDQKVEQKFLVQWRLN